MEGSRSHFHAAGSHRRVLIARRSFSSRASRSKRIAGASLRSHEEISRMTLKLVIGNKNYSSWSMRPWLALRANNIAFEEIFIPLYTGEADKQRILDVTRSGKVPALVDGDITVWDSLAIIEYLAERFPRGAAVAGGSRRPRPCAFDFGGDAFGIHGAAQRMRHEPAPAGQARSRCRRMRAPTSRGSSRSGPNAASVMANPGRSCSAPSAARTRCSRRWCIAFAPMRSR